MKEQSEKIIKIIGNIEAVFAGKRDVVELALNTMISGGHLLIVDLPGVGKTTLARALSKSIEGKTKRIQFTPDLLPTDVTGVNIYIQAKNSFEFHPGPVFTNILLADEINRATPRAQSSLLEAMEEAQVSIDGSTYPVKQPFMVIATQNPIEIQGTFPLPEAQLDRFLISAAIGYPSRADESRILDDRTGADPMDSVKPVMSLDEVESLKESARGIRIDDSIKKYILDITETSRRRDDVMIGASPRASLALMFTSRTSALMEGREYVIPEDVKKLAAPTLAHRLVLRNSTRLNLEPNRAVINSILEELPVPRPG